MDPDDELPDIPDLPREDSTSKRTLSSTSLTSDVGHQERTRAKKISKDKGQATGATSSGPRSRSRRSGDRNAYLERQKQWLNESRSRETSEQKETRQASNRNQMATARNKETSEERLARLETMRTHNRAARNQETADEREARNEANRIQTAAGRNSKKTTVNFKDATRSQAILDGEIPVKPLHIGSMTEVCEHCGALRFPWETPSSCCGGGKVVLAPFPAPPEPLLELFTGQSEDSQIFRKNARPLNNAVCLTSLKNHYQSRQGGWQPSVIFQGRIQTRVGPLQHTPGENPTFAQLYVLDAEMESTTRFNNMTLPSETSIQEITVLQELLQRVQDCLHASNPFIQDFKQILEIPDEELANGRLIISAKAPTGEHARRYNAQLDLKEVSIVTNCQSHDLVLHKRGGGLQTVSDLNPNGMPLHFTLLFPHGTKGWDHQEMHPDGRRRVTPKEFFTYHLRMRDGPNQDYLHRAGKLFQEWICMAWVTIENQRLEYQKQNQKALRADTYKSVKDATEERLRDMENLAPREDGIYRDDHRPAMIGRKILCSSFQGGPRWYNAKFQDAMAIVRKYGKPDYFITMTCNPKWPEIMEALLPGQKAHDRPDIVAMIFKQKMEQLMKDLTAGGCFGQIVAFLYCVEFQKRGLPHVHILIILAAQDRTLTPELVDGLVRAELPPSPDDVDDPDQKQMRQTMQEIVLNNMVHSKCGEHNPQAQCMENGKCSKGFPKDFQKQTSVDPDNYYATYRRRSPTDGGRSIMHKGKLIDNSWVIPYNPQLSHRFACHINVECCASPKAAKYLYKYVTKGNDRARVATEIEGEPRDEIQEYQDLRSVGSSEATYHILGYNISKNKPAVMPLRIHLKEQQQVVFDINTEMEALERQRDTELTAFFTYNQGLNDNDPKPMYMEMPEGHVYDKKEKEWRIRKRGEPSVGRIHQVNPVAGDVYFLRRLLCSDHSRGKTSFEDMLTLPNGTVCETFKGVCLELGLLDDDAEWRRLLDMMEVSSMCREIRQTYIVILLFVEPADARALFEEFWPNWCDDLEHAHRRTTGEDLSDAQKRTLVLLDLERRLQAFEKELQNYGLPVPTPEEQAAVHNVTSLQPGVLREELDFDRQVMEDEANLMEPTYTADQQIISDALVRAVENNEELQVFIDARGGCGKTYLLNTILRRVRSMDGGSPALAMATTGIAANLLLLGRTFHSRLKAPLTPSEESTLQITAQSNLARLVRESKLLIIDEATMLDKFLLEALDRTLRDLMDADRPFGGKIVVLAGDFRQCLPVVKGASRSDTVKHCINKSRLWQNFKVFQLTTNMRVRASGDPQLEEFDRWTLSIGNGEMRELQVPDDLISTKIVKNSRENPSSEQQAMEGFVDQIFPDIVINIGDPHWLEGRCILAATNKEVDMINDMVVGKLPGTTDKMYSADSLDNNGDLLRVTEEYLNTLQPNGFPTHVLKLKPGMPLMLLRNLDPSEGLCNGTKLVYVRNIGNKVLECKIVGSLKTVLIPRIIFIPKIGEYAFEWQRRQFPVRPAFATTINKAQGQTLKMAGIWLRTQVFTHGQLYVACSRVGSRDRLRFAVRVTDNGEAEKIPNVVFKEVLLK